MHDVPKHSQASLYPSEVVTLALLFAIKGVGNRAFYRWVERWPEVCAELTGAPQVLAVGDLHIENFGTWRDAEGRLVWGVNDFDEAGPLPYTNDLVRLATSAHLAIAANHLTLAPRDACVAILEGYAAGLASGGRPFILAERQRRLRAMVMSETV